MNRTNILLSVLSLATAGAAAWGWKTQTELKAAQVEMVKTQEAKTEAIEQKEAEMRDAFSKLEDQHQKDVTSIMEKHQKELDALRAAERVRMAAAFEQFGDILDGNKKTLEYINLLEQKVKGGKAVSDLEVQKLATIATGLGYLQKQYQKPFQEFGELEVYLSKRAGENVTTPNMRNAFWKRIFSRDFREQEREFYRTEGERRGFQEASRRFSRAYDAAQKQMAAANLDMEKSMKAITGLIEDKSRTEGLDQFFEGARKALKTHQNLLDFVPESAAPEVETVKP